ncbi:hypothetical protein M2480_000422 [Parabacteroides sp. PFB2-12]|uniref:type IX secretion/gliding motility protein PorT/SprT n=1 Tax=unclassified Parabacteroides TaxID=2649774 RepID=UPI002475B8B5|nr:MULTISPECIES: porin family protein [unclassified Parabacteroides]MDH6342042.1 hypothetical protein [Parabacteroides sp. PM6-13]MDH6389462.1 hypothetical protein [Parabacteroides sp. PFB2-12]
MRKGLFILSVFLFAVGLANAQTERVKNQPYADMKLYHLGFHVGLHSQDMILTHSGLMENGETWFAEIPSYNPGFSVGVIGDMYLSPYFNLRVVPTLHFGDKTFMFREKETGEEFRTDIRANYLTLPVNIKYSALRLNNYRPYLIGGVYGQMDIGRKKGNPLLMKGFDFGVEFGVGCDIYLPFFKLCPEIKFCFGLGDMLDKKRSDLKDDLNLMKYTNALSRASSRMVVITFNFE